MAPRYALAALLALALQSAIAQSGDVNLQNLLAALTQGSEVTMYTPLANGMLQVTSFKPPARMTEAQAAAAVESARQQLAAVGITNPTADQFAHALVGGPVNTAQGSVQLAGVLPVSGQPATVRSQVVSASGTAPVAGPSAAAGGSAPFSRTPISAQEREAAISQLAAIGILNPSEDQIRTAVLGGTISTVNGLYRLPGISAPASGAPATGSYR
jgi:hypothetical protein